MECVFKTKIASRGWHVYQKTVWPKPKIGEKVVACKEKGKAALQSDPFSVAWMLKRKDKIAPVVAGHIPREISRAVWFFIEKGGSLSGKVFEERCRPSPIPKGGLEILLKVTFVISDEKRRYMERLKSIISENYVDPEATESFALNESCRFESEENVDSDMEEIILEDDEPEDEEGVICLD